MAVSTAVRNIRWSLGQWGVDVRVRAGVWLLNRQARRAFPVHHRLPGWEWSPVSALVWERRRELAWSSATLAGIAGVLLAYAAVPNRGDLNEHSPGFQSRSLSPVAVKVPPVPPPVAKAPVPAVPEARLERGQRVILASKRHSLLQVFEWDSAAWRRLAEFPMAHGEVPGGKTKEGDKKTPEGFYWVLDIQPGPPQGELFGPLVMPLNYPNPQDMADGKTGGGIWIHGVESGLDIETTKGCLELANTDVVELAGYVRLPTPVIILSEDDPALSPRGMDFDWIATQRKEVEPLAKKGVEGSVPRTPVEETMRRARNFLDQEAAAAAAHVEISPEIARRIADRVESWRRAWSARDIADYGAQYHLEFKGRGGRDRDSFLRRKNLIFAKNDTILVDVDELALRAQGNLVRADFVQDYQALADGDTTYSSRSHKSLWLQLDGDEWKLVRE